MPIDFSLFAPVDIALAVSTTKSSMPKANAYVVNNTATTSPAPVSKSENFTQTKTDAAITYSLSLKSLKNKLSGTAETQEQTQVVASQYTKEDLDKAWYKYPAVIDQEIDLHYIFRQSPVLTDQGEIIIKTDNSYILNRIENLIPQLKAYLFEQLNNNTIEIKTELTETNRKAIATDKEKAKIMAESNPELRKLFIEWSLKLK